MQKILIYFGIFFAFAQTTEASRIPPTRAAVCVAWLHSIKSSVSIRSLQTSEKEVALRALMNFRTQRLKILEGSARFDSVFSTGTSSKRSQRKIAERIFGIQDSSKRALADERSQLRQLAVVLEGDQILDWYKNWVENIDEISMQQRARFLSGFKIQLGLDILGSAFVLSHFDNFLKMLHDPGWRLYSMIAMPLAAEIFGGADLFLGIPFRWDLKLTQQISRFNRAFKKIEEDPTFWMYGSRNYSVTEAVANAFFKDGFVQPAAVSLDSVYSTGGMHLRILESRSSDLLGATRDYHSRNWMAVDYLLRTNPETEKPQLVMVIRIEDKRPRNQASAQTVKSPFMKTAAALSQ